MWHHFSKGQKTALGIAGILFAVLLSTYTYSFLQPGIKADVMSSNCNVPLSAKVTAPTEGQIFIKTSSTLNIALAGEVKGTQGHTINTVQFALYDQSSISSAPFSRLSATTGATGAGGLTTYSATFSNAQIGSYRVNMEVDYDNSMRLVSPDVSFTVSATTPSPSPSPSTTPTIRPTSTPTITPSPSPTPTLLPTSTPSPKATTSPRVSWLQNWLFPTAQAQIPSAGRLCITVTQAGSSTPISGATVLYLVNSGNTNTLGSYQDITNNQGYVELVGLRIAPPYPTVGTVTITKQGYASVTLSGVELNQNSNVPYATELKAEMTAVTPSPLACTILTSPEQQQVNDAIQSVKDTIITSDRSGPIGPLFEQKLAQAQSTANVNQGITKLIQGLRSELKTTLSDNEEKLAKSAFNEFIADTAILNGIGKHGDSESNEKKKTIKDIDLSRSFSMRDGLTYRLKIKLQGDRLDLGLNGGVGCNPLQGSISAKVRLDLTYSIIVEKERAAGVFVKVDSDKGIYNIGGAFTQRF
ncbi:MAG TPA: carboxypeptidase-like regulatory domain-containing protein [Patescibacteria group bacterium]